MGSSEFKNILVIHFGQLGDVVLGLPALVAIRKHFSEAKITLLVGKSTEQVARLANVADEYLAVDRVELRDGNKITSIKKIGKLVAEVRRHKFDLVIDLHSLYETNLLGILSGSPVRHFANRDRRSIDSFSNYPVKAPKEDRSMHHVDRYLSVISSLGIADAERQITIAPPPNAVLEASAMLDGLKIADKKLIGFFLGAGHHSRRWPVENFVAAAGQLSLLGDFQTLVFLGPEEREFRPTVELAFGNKAIVIRELRIDVFYAMMSRLDVLVSGDTGPMHLAATAGAGVVLLSQIDSPDIFQPLAKKLTVINDRNFDEITVEQVVTVVREMLEKT